MASNSYINLLKAIKSLVILLLSLDIHFDVISASNAEVEQHLELGKKLLSAGQLADALSHFHAAVEGDPDNYLTYFRRATVYLALGKSKSALPDLDKVLELKPDFTAARAQRANVLLKQGRLNEAKMDYELVVKRDADHADAREALMTIEPLENDIHIAKQLYERRDYEGAIALLTKAIEICPWDPELREIRAECYIAQGDLFKAVGDIRPTTKLRSDNTKGFNKLSLLHFKMGEADESLTQVKECLKLDPDHKECFSHYKKVKKLVKLMQEAQEASSQEKWVDCTQKASQILKTENTIHPYVHKAKSHTCHCEAMGGKSMEALKSCNELLDMDPENIDALCDRAEAYIHNEQYEEAKMDFQKAHNIDQQNRRAGEGLDRIQKLIKNSQKRDYYKILGVKRNAKKKEILKAYRKLAIIWHPDKYEGNDKEKAKKMFLDIAAAKEVLTDKEKRQKYDLGEDPLDPEQQGGGGGPFWQQGFNPFGSGGFQFKFHFN
ncbi:hypothetical protein CHS0354_014050 [Potamilus streckersoni]|uniref:J domain-containing protein n=1 Tax=Potamilus streckersoni TaxID=2493646 RepID=A0AAE0VQ93_9BIVA|nr:hypothetical protein CHS0354_014050 [Potamilus streckersoni]